PSSMTRAEGTVITVLRGAIEVVEGDRLQRLRLSGTNAHREHQLAVGDRVTFDPAKGALLDVLPRRSQLARLPSFRRPRPQVSAANVDRLAIGTSVATPPFRSGAVDRFLLAAHTGGLESILVVNKLDLLGEHGELEEAVRAYQGILPLFAVSAAEGRGL